MKRLFLWVFALMTIAVSAQNYSYFDNDLRLYDEGEAVTTLTHFGFFPITDEFGFTDYASIEGNNEYGYGQVLLGGYYNISDELSVYLLAGKENASNDVRMGYMVYYTTGDKFRTYAFYQRNQNPFSSDTKLSEWYDLMLRVSLISKDKNSLYVGGRYMKYYGLGLPVSIRQSLNGDDNLYLGFTLYNDVDDDYDGSNWTPTITLAVEFN